MGIITPGGQQRQVTAEQWLEAKVRAVHMEHAAAIHLKLVGAALVDNDPDASESAMALRAVTAADTLMVALDLATETPVDVGSVADNSEPEIDDPGVSVIRMPGVD